MRSQKNILKYRLDSRRGQSTIEFVLSFVLVLGFFLFFIQASLFFAIGNYIHYSTYMSARAYFAAGSDPGDQFARADKVLKSMILRGGASRFSFFADGVTEGFPGKGVFVGAGSFLSSPTQYNRQNAWEEGARYGFGMRFRIMPILMSNSEAITVKLVSESWLGRETTETECVEQMSRMATQSGLPSKWEVDNGC